MIPLFLATVLFAMLQLVGYLGQHLGETGLSIKIGVSVRIIVGICISVAVASATVIELQDDVLMSVSEMFHITVIFR